MTFRLRASGLCSGIGMVKQEGFRFRVDKFRADASRYCF